MDLLDLSDAFLTAFILDSNPSDSLRVDPRPEHLSPELEASLQEALLPQDGVFESHTEGQQEEHHFEHGGFERQVQDRKGSDYFFGDIFDGRSKSQEASEQPADPLITQSQSQPLALTRENLERLAMSTGSKLPKTETTASEIPLPGKSNDAKSISTTSVGFEQRAFQNGILNPLKSAPFPVNDKDIKRRLDQSRGSASPPQSQYNRFVGRLDNAINETKTIEMYDKYVFQDSEDRHYDSGYLVQPDKGWTAFPSNLGFNNGLSVPKPDKLEGFSRSKFPPSINEIQGTTLVKDDANYITLPHMTVEYKAKNKSAHEAKVQSMYNGAAMVYGRNEALAHIKKNDPPRQPAVLSAAVVGPTWDIYGHYAHTDETTERVEYHQHRVHGGSMETFNDYKQSRKVLRNMQDFAREQAGDLKDRLHEDYKEKEAEREAAKSATKSKSGNGSSASKPSSDAPSVTSQKSTKKKSSSGQNASKPASSNASVGSTGYSGTARPSQPGDNPGKSSAGPVSDRPDASQAARKQQPGSNAGRTSAAQASGRPDASQAAQKQQSGSNAGKTSATPTSGRPDASQAARQQQSMPPPARPQSPKQSATKPSHPTSPATQVAKDPAGRPRQQSSTSSSGSTQAPAPRATSSPRPAAAPARPTPDARHTAPARPTSDARPSTDKRPTAPPSRNSLGVLSGKHSASSRASASSAASSASTSSAEAADMRRYRVRDDDEQKDLTRRRSDSPEKNRPARPQDQKGAGAKKSSVFGKFASGTRRDGTD